MDFNANTFEQLRARGYELGRPYVQDRAGLFVVVNNVAMPITAARQLAAGRTTLEAIAWTSARLKFLKEQRVIGREDGPASFRGRRGVVVGRAIGSPQYAIQFNDGPLEWVMSNWVDAVAT